VVGDVVLKGTGIGAKSVHGTVYVAKTLKEAEAMPDGSILVVPFTDEDYTPVIQRAAAIIAEEGGLTSHAAIAGIEYGIPVIVGAEGATEKLLTGEEITMDCQRGLVYRGVADVK